MGFKQFLGAIGLGELPFELPKVHLWKLLVEEGLCVPTISRDFLLGHPVPIKYI